jgi:hypothetical protein
LSVSTARESSRFNRSVGFSRAIVFILRQISNLRQIRIRAALVKPDRRQRVPTFGDEHWVPE